MRSLAFVVILLAQALHAEPTLLFTTDHTRITTGSSASVFVANHSDETAHDLVITVELSPGLAFINEVLAVPLAWECTSTERAATCRVATLATQENGLVSFAVAATDGVAGHRSVTATLSASDVAVVDPIVFDFITSGFVLVTNADDFGAGSLRAAIDEVNEQAVCGTEVPCHIGFGSGLPFDTPFILRPTSPLPALRKCNVTIHGPDDYEFPRLVKLVVISGENATYGHGLEIRASCAEGVPGVSIESIVVNSWPWNGIYFEAPTAHVGINFGHTMNRVYVGTDATGLLPRPNGSRGIVTDSPHEVLSVYNSIVSGNGRSGIALFQGKHGNVVGTKLGVGRDDRPMGNSGGAGFFSIGVPFFLAYNTIAHNGVGVAVAKGTPEAAMIANAIYSNAGLPIDWGIDGRTPSDDESDGVPNAPRVMTAFYDASANVTYVRGVVYLSSGRFGSRFIIEPFLATSARGDVIFTTPLFPVVRTAPTEGGDVPFEVGIPGNHRGRFLAVQAHAVSDTNVPLLSSEMSEGIFVP